MGRLGACKKRYRQYSCSGSMMEKRGVLYWAQLVFTLLVAMYLTVPILMSITAGLTKNYFVGISSGLTFDWVLKVWVDYQSSIFLSIYIALACLVCTLVLGVPAAYAMSKMKGKFARTLEELLMLPVAIPGIATALALIISYGAVGNFRTSWLFILVGHVVFTLPFMVRAVLAVIHSIDIHTLEEGARSLGANFWQRFFGVIIPNCKSGILAGSLMVITLSIGEFNMSLLLHTPFTQTLPVGLADAYASLRIEVGSAYTVVFFILIMPLLLALQLVNRKRI
jgi:putative spermidine/putrescine transport system permease protein